MKNSKQKKQPNTVEEMKKIAEARGGKCLSSEYVNAHTKLKWQCSEGHTWEAVPHSIKRGSWCPKCGIIARGQKRKSTIEEMQAISEERGGKTLSSEYVNSETKLHWECAKGHQWEAVPSSIKRGIWCPKCAGKQAGTIEEMHAIAEKRGGKCLSSEYVNKETKLKWQCAEGHQWEANPASIKRGSWCSACAGKRKSTLEEMQAIAEARGGKSLSSQYVNSEIKLKWQCAKGHQWEAKPANIKQGTWCPVCARGRTNQAMDAKKLTIEAMQAIAKERGGKCLSDEYVNNQIKLKWQCSKGHLWEATPKNIKTQRWCPVCAGKRSEGMVF